MPRPKADETKPVRIGRNRHPTTTAGRLARKGQRDTFKPTDDQRATVQMLVSFGVTQDDICLHIRKKDGNPISSKTLQRHFRADLDVGQSKANSIVAGKLFQAAKDGNITAQIFWLKTRAKWYETERKELTGAGGIPLSNGVQPPAGMTTDKFRSIAQELLKDV